MAMEVEGFLRVYIMGQVEDEPERFTAPGRRRLTMKFRIKMSDDVGVATRQVFYFSKAGGDAVSKSLSKGSWVIVEGNERDVGEIPVVHADKLTWVTKSMFNEPDDREKGMMPC